MVKILIPILWIYIKHYRLNNHLSIVVCTQNNLCIIIADINKTIKHTIKFRPDHLCHKYATITVNNVSTIAIL